MGRLAGYLPALDWARRYDRRAFLSDGLAAAIVTIMLIPQSLAYAMLAGLPPVVGLYASILPLVAYALFGTSRTLAVGPVAVVSLLTATAAGAVSAPGSAEYVTAALTLALLSGLILFLNGRGATRRRKRRSRRRPAQSGSAGRPPRPRRARRTIRADQQASQPGRGRQRGRAAAVTSDGLTRSLPLRGASCAPCRLRNVNSVSSWRRMYCARDSLALT